MSKPPPSPPCFAANELTPEEVAAIEARGRLPAEFAAVLAPAATLQVSAGREQGSGKTVIIVDARVVIPQEMLNFPVTGLVTANGQSAVAERAASSIGAVPVLRLVVDRASLGEEVRAHLEKMRVKLPDLPSLRGTPSEEA